MIFEFGPSGTSTGIKQLCNENFEGFRGGPSKHRSADPPNLHPKPCSTEGLCSNGLTCAAGQSSLPAFTHWPPRSSLHLQMRTCSPAPGTGVPRVRTHTEQVYRLGPDSWAGSVLPGVAMQCLALQHYQEPGAFPAAPRHRALGSDQHTLPQWGKPWERQRLLFLTQVARTHTHTLASTYARTCIHTHTHRCTHGCTDSHMDKHTQLCTQPHTVCAQLYTRTRVLICTQYSHMHSHTVYLMTVLHVSVHKQVCTHVCAHSDIHTCLCGGTHMHSCAHTPTHARVLTHRPQWKDNRL